MSSSTMIDWVGIAAVVSAVAAAIVSIITALRLNKVADTVAKVETNTNSMSERLERAAHQAGQLQGGADERVRAESIAVAKEEGRAAVINEKALMQEDIKPIITTEKIVTDQIVTSGKK